MEFLENAVSAVKTGINFEDSLQGTSKAIFAYQEAINCFKEVDRRKELRNEDSKNELQRQLSFYINKVQKLRLQSVTKMLQDTNDEDDKELINRILSTMLQEKPTTTFCEIAGLNDVKKTLKHAVVLPIKHPELFSEEVFPYKGFLLFGATGTGKSFLARALANAAMDLGTTFFSLSPSYLMSQYEGQSEKLIRLLFKTARLLKPSVLFIDEVDSMAMAQTNSTNENQKKVSSELRVQMDSVDNSGVFILAATRNPQELDDAFLQRFDKLLHIPMPNEETRYKLFKMQFKSNLNISEKILRKASSISEGLTGSDITVLAKKARMMDLTRLEKQTHFKQIQKGYKTFWRPCQSTDVNAVQRKLGDIPSHLLEYKFKPKKEDVIRCVKEARTTANGRNIRSLEYFDEKYGELSRGSLANRARDRKKAGRFFGSLNKLFK